MVKPIGLFTTPEKQNSVLCLLLAVMTLALYNPVNRHPFVNYDDDRYVTANLHVRAGLTWNTTMWALTSTEQANWHPVTWMSHALDCTVFRLNPAGHHFISVLLHAVNVMLLFWLLVRATDRVGSSLLVAAIFALHPLNVESVAWISERKNVLCTMFLLLALVAYGWYARKPSWQRYLAVFAACAAGLASKPMVITLPFVLLLWDYWPLGRLCTTNSDSPTSRTWQQLVLEKLPLFVLSAACAVITLHAQRAGGAIRSTQQFSFGVRLENAICAYATYLWKMVWPSRLAPLYPHPGTSLPGWQVVTSALVLFAITALVWHFRAHRYLPVGWLWFLGTLVPVIGLVQVGDAAMADRYAYIPLIGIFVMLVFGMADLLQAIPIGTVWRAVPAVAILSVLALVTHRQIDYWSSSYTLWAHALAVTQNNFVAEDNLGGVLLSEGKPEEAFQHFEAALRINPYEPMSRTNIGAYLQTHGRIAEAIAQYDSAIALTSDAGLRAQVYANLGAARRELGEDDLALQSFDKALQMNPNQANAWLGMGLLAQKQGRLDQSIVDFSRSIDLQPTAEAWLDLGRSLQKTGRTPEALDAYRRALQFSPGLAEAQRAMESLTAARQ